MINDTTVQIHPPDGHRIFRNGEYREVTAWGAAGRALRVPSALGLCSTAGGGGCFPAWNEGPRSFSLLSMFSAGLQCLLQRANQQFVLLEKTFQNQRNI